MEASCQRCHEAVRDGDRYCANCGMPQLMYVAAELPLLALADASELGSDSLSSGADAIVSPGGIAWRPALNAAMLFSVPAGLLCSHLTPFGESLSFFWIIGASSWAVSVYAKRSRLGRMTAGAGARIGLITGLFASWLVAAVNGFQIWAARFLFHQGALIDAGLMSKVDEGLKLNQQLWVSMGMAGAQIAQLTQTSRSWMLSPEGRAGDSLSEIAFEAGLLIFFAMLGGAVRARIGVKIQPAGN